MRTAVQQGAAALSINTSMNTPYDDEEAPDGFFYAYRTGPIDQPDNRALRSARVAFSKSRPHARIQTPRCSPPLTSTRSARRSPCSPKPGQSNRPEPVERFGRPAFPKLSQAPLVYFVATAPGRYKPIYPCFITGDDQGARRVLVTPGRMIGPIDEPEPVLVEDVIERQACCKLALISAISASRTQGRRNAAPTSSSSSPNGIRAQSAASSPSPGGLRPTASVDSALQSRATEVRGLLQTRSGA